MSAQVIAEGIGIAPPYQRQTGQTGPAGPASARQGQPAGADGADGPDGPDGPAGEKFPLFLPRKKKPEGAVSSVGRPEDWPTPTLSGPLCGQLGSDSAQKSPLLAGFNN